MEREAATGRDGVVNAALALAWIVYREIISFVVCDWKLVLVRMPRVQDREAKENALGRFVTGHVWQYRGARDSGSYSFLILEDRVPTVPLVVLEDDWWYFVRDIDSWSSCG